MTPGNPYTQVASTAAQNAQAVLEKGTLVWAAHLRHLARTGLRERAPDKDPPWGEVWLLLNSAIRKYLRIHARTRGSISCEEQEDLAAEFSSDLLRRIVSGAWDASERNPAEIAAFLSAVARNGLITFLTRARRTVPLEARGTSPTRETVTAFPGGRGSRGADARLLGREYAEALRGCVLRLAPKARRIWMLRVFSGLSSKQIAAHPEIRLKAGHVDVILLRARKALRECMRGRGLSSEEIPPGTFTQLWTVFHMEQTRRD